MTATVEATQASAPLGHRMRRKEDARLITGRGQYVDDIRLPGTLWMALVRSTEGHAKIVSIDGSAALQRPGIKAVLTGEDLDLGAPLPMVWVPPGVEVLTPEHWPLAKGAVKHVGDPVAVVVGDDKYAVVDASEDVVVEYEALPAVVDPEKALEDGARSSGPSSAPTRRTSGRSAAATSRPPWGTPTWWSSGGS